MRILVTGCGGFLGREIVKQLLDRGDEVVGLSRRSVGDDVAHRITNLVGDLTDAEYVRRSIKNVDAVIHTAAVARIWGPWRVFFENNVLATRNILAACQAASIEKLIYTSSPSVSFDGSDQRGISEIASYPKKWLAHYPHTKAIAEREVIQANQADGLRTVALRPHLIWGPGDPHLLPRILDRAASGKLRIIGDGRNRVDTVHVVNAAAAHLDAMDAMDRDPEHACGRAYFITQDEPVDCWQWIATLCDMHDVPPPRRRISFAAAYAAGAACEATYWLFGRTSEPPMTRFVASQLAKDHWFDIAAAKQYLGYRPRLSMQQALRTLQRDQ